MDTRPQSSTHMDISLFDPCVDQIHAAVASIGGHMSRRSAVDLIEYMGQVGRGWAHYGEFVVKWGEPTLYGRPVTIRPA